MAPPVSVPKRRLFLAGIPFLLIPSTVRAGFDRVRPGVVLSFPRDFGSHPGFRTEWWYITGWAQAAHRSFGVQVTFFRNRPDVQENNPSRFAPKQLLFAHAALAEEKHGRLRHDQRSARSGFGVAESAQGDTRIQLDDWSLKRINSGYATRVRARDFALELNFAPTQKPLLQGAKGFSRKGPLPTQASYYYSLPQLSLSGSIVLGEESLKVRGVAWLDHEWSSERLPQGAAGWDWVGMNFSDGSALMAFRMRAKEGNVLWAGATFRDADGGTQSYPPSQVEFIERRRWRSPRTGAEYPVAMQVVVDDMEFELTPLLEDQELDARASTGTVYWEGAVLASAEGTELGRGYLELTGYWSPLRL